VQQPKKQLSGKEKEYDNGGHSEKTWGRTYQTPPQGEREITSDIRTEAYHDALRPYHRSESPRPEKNHNTAAPSSAQRRFVNKWHLEATRGEQGDGGFPDQPHVADLGKEEIH
jgi:hypothetical protein